MREKKILIVAGEASGDMYGARLVEEICRQSRTPVRFFGCAGSAMRSAGVSPVVTVEEISVHGFVEVLSHLEYIFDGFRRLVSAAERERPDLVILIDFPDFNIRLAQRLKHMGMRMVYFISPQFWAWRPGRIRVLRGLIQEMICILPFEESFYRRAGVPAEYVGHPLLEILKVESTREELFQKLGLDLNRPMVAILPGSRKNEIRHNLPTLLRTVRRVHARHPEIQFVLAISSSLESGYVGRVVDRCRRNGPGPIPLTLAENQTQAIVKYSQLAIVSSGTATLEAALLGTPLICVYRVSPLSWWVGQKLIDVPYYCLVNLILKRPVVPELYQGDFTVEKLESEICKLLASAEARRQMGNEFSELKQVLSLHSSPMRRAGEIVLTHLETPSVKNESNESTMKTSSI